MNTRVLRTLIRLLWLFLAVFVLMKLFFPQQLLLVIENDKIVVIGKFIDRHDFIRIAFNAIITVITAHFYLCSCLQCWKMGKVMYVILFVYSILINVCLAWNTLIGTLIDYTVLIVLPLLLRCKVKQSLFIFTIHNLGQWCLLFIRSSEFYISNVNYASTVLLVFDVYIWLILYYLYSNLHKEGTLWELALSRFSAIRQKLRSKKSSQK